nr:tetratricopeptide repeat protein [Treponema sp.]
SLDDASTESSGATASDDIADLSGLDDLPSLDDNSSEVAANDDNFSAPSLDDLLGGDDAFGTDDSAGTEAPADGTDLGGTDDLAGADSFGIDDFATDGLDSLGDLPVADETASIDSAPADDFSTNDLGDLSDLADLPSLDDTSSDDNSAAPSFDDLLGDSSDVNPSDPFASSDESSNPFGAIDSGDSADSFDVPDFSDSTDSDSTDTTSSADSEDFASATPDGLFDSSDMELPDLDIPDGSGVDTGNLFTSEIPDYDDGLDSSDSMLDGEAVEGTLETFDTSGMDGDIDFGITDTDSALSGGNDFELGGADEFALEGSDFEIPGFSDVESIEEKKSTPVFGAKGRGRGKGGLDSPDFTGALESEKLPPNTLSDEQYKRFLKNLNEYPLNVRLAFEDFIVQDEFTDDAEFEVIEKILNKAPARQVASVLEKMLDISIPVPRDFEHRTAEEYEAYKKSIQYQLRNKIIPAMIVGVVAILVGWGLFNFGKFCIYIPAKAVSLYKQGYELIQKDEYPQSEQKFNEAVKYKLNKKWFFNYARAYREHKQYQRSSEMYTKILRNFKQDKQAGLEYADMMLNDLYNYEHAEEILNREVLDYHINDADGRLLLGDTYLEWGTEKDPSKLDLAKEQYSILSQIYGANDLYNSRLMRYYVRTDNLLQVLNYKAIFEEREKSLSSQDCTEMSGYLLDKLYGPLSPSEEQLRTKIEGIKPLLIRAIKLDPDNAVGLYNLGKYYVNTNEISYVEATLKDSVKKFSQAEVLKKRDIYKFIDAYRLLGENYIKTGDTMKAQEQYTNGISLYTTERDNSGFAGNLDIGKLYADLANLNYFVSGDYDLAKENYKHSIELGNDSPAIRYRIGYVNYRNKNYQEALGSFMKAGEANRKEDNLLLAMANTLSLRDDDYSAEGYYEQLLARMDDEIADKQRVFPRTSARDYDIVNTYLKASNNYGVTLHRLAKRTGNSAKNAQAIVQFQHSLRAWDALTRNQETLVRLEGSNLAQENIKYITHMYSDYEPAIYIDIPRTLTDGEGL